MTSRPSLGVRLFRALLRLLPADFRDEFGGAMAADVEGAGQHGAGFWWREFSSLAAAVLREHVDALRQDVKHALRMMRRTPGFTLVVVTAIGLGIGMNTTVFTLVNAVLLRGLPYSNPDEIVLVETYNREQRDDGPTSWPDYEDWKKDTQAFRGLAATAPQPFSISGDGGTPERAAGSRVTPNTFGLLGQPVLLGRDFREEDGAPGAAPVIILGHSVWEARFASDPTVLGRVLRVNEVPMEIIGVMPRGVRFPNNADAWIPLVPAADGLKRDARGVEVFGRLKGNVSLTEAQTELDVIAARLERAYPQTNKSIGVVVLTFNASRTGANIRAGFLMLLAAVSLLLLIACANVANLLIARAMSRAREIGVRIALGASRRTIIRQLLTESLLLGCLGGIVGLGFAYLGVTLFDRSIANVTKPYWIVFSFDWTVFGWLALVCIGTGLVCGLAPALQLARTDTNEVLKDASRGATTGRGRLLTSSLVVIEVAFTLALLAGAGVMIRSFLGIYNADLGARIDNVLMSRISLPTTRYPDPAARLRFAEQLQERLLALPGVEHASLATSFPGEGAGAVRIDIEGQPRASAELPRVVRSPVVDTVYFGTFGIVASEGRLFDARDGAPGAEAVVVNQRFAEANFGRESPIGRRIMVRPDLKDTAWASIIGVIPHVRHGDTTRDELDAVVYRPLRMAPPASFGIALRSQQPVATLSSGVRTAVAGLDQDLPVFQIQTMEENLALQRWPFRVFGTVFVLFAIFGLVLSTIGMYAVTAYSVGQRRTEIGLRMALGAHQSQISWMVLKRGLGQLAIGVPLGLALAYVVTLGMKSLLVGIGPGDPVTLASILLIVAMVTVAACLVPARRAARLNPTTALRN